MNTAKEQIEAFTSAACKVLRNAVLRAALPGGHLPIDCSPERAAAALEPYEPALLADSVALHELLRVAYFEGVRSVHRDLSAAPGIDPEMLDQSVEHFTTRTGDGEAIRL
jgi:hypothetical protein